MLVGSYPPDICGVGDNTARLVQKLTELNCEVEVFSGRNWKLNSFSSWRQKISNSKLDILHIQYPTLAYGASLVPQLLALTLKKGNIICTIHEFSQAHFLRKLAVLPFFFLTKHIVFTNSFERNCVCRVFPFVKKKSSIIPIGNSFNVFSYNTLLKEKKTIVCFGLIRPDKGIEEFLDLACFSKTAGLHYKFIVVGAVSDNTHKYYQNLRKDDEYDNVVWEINHSMGEVANILSKCTYAYLPFPDGVSERRSSLLAAFAAGLVVFTTEGKQTSKELVDIVKIVKSNAEVLDLLAQYEEKEDEKQVYIQKGTDYLKTKDWVYIANKYKDLYEKLLKVKS